MFFVLGVIHNYEVRVEHRKKHMLNTDFTPQVRVEHRKTYAQHGLSNCEFIVTLAKSVLKKKHHMLNTDLATVNS